MESLTFIRINFFPGARWSQDEDHSRRDELHQLRGRKVRETSGFARDGGHRAPAPAVPDPELSPADPVRAAGPQRHPEAGEQQRGGQRKNFARNNPQLKNSDLGPEAAKKPGMFRKCLTQTLVLKYQRTLTMDCFSWTVKTKRPERYGMARLTNGKEIGRKNSTETNKRFSFWNRMF